MRFRVKATLGNSDGIFDAASSFGDESELAGTPREIAQEVARFLGSLTPASIEEMRYGTPQFFVELLITPEGQPEGTLFTEGRHD